MKRKAMMRMVSSLLLAALVLTGCGPEQGRKEINVTSDTLYVQKVENLPDDFIMGMDASCVPALEASGVQYAEVQGAVSARGYFPGDMPIEMYPADFVKGCLVAAWESVKNLIMDMRRKSNG